MDYNKNVLVFCYFFPPNDGVGGRRWVKFCSQLIERGYDVTVVTPAPFTDVPSTWNNQVHPKLRMLFVQDEYPKVLLKPVNSFSRKIAYRLALSKVKRKYRGNYFDASCLMQKCINEKVIPYIKENNIKTIVVSGAPFAYFSDVVKIKDIFPGIKVVLDYRDLWTTSKYHFGGNVLQTQGKERFDAERQNEIQVLKRADKILTVSTDLYHGVLSLLPEAENKMFVLKNGFDPADGEIKEAVHAAGKKEKIYFTYIGTINCGEAYYTKLTDALDRITRADHRIEVRFYGNGNAGFERKLKTYENPAFHIYPRISLSEMTSVAGESDFLLYIKREDELPNSFATKFYDYLRLRKFIVILSPSGEVTRFIEQNKIGYVLDENNIQAGLEMLISKTTQGSLEFNGSVDLTPFSVQSLTTQLEEIILKN